MSLHTNVIALPRAFAGLGSIATRSGGAWRPLDVTLALTLAERLHGTQTEVRATARRLVDKVSREQQPELRAIARGLRGEARA